MQVNYDEGFEDLALMADQTPQVAPLTVDFHEHFIKMQAPLPISGHEASVVRRQPL